VSSQIWEQTLSTFPNCPRKLKRRKHYLNIFYKMIVVLFLKPEKTHTKTEVKTKN
jgi:hypothetical protein